MILGHCSIETTLTDLGSSFNVSLPPWAFAEIGFGTTVLGASKVLMLSTLGAVRVSPDAAFALVPTRFNSTSTVSLGSRFVIATHNLPSLPLAARASVRGKLMPPWV